MKSPRIRLCNVMIEAHANAVKASGSPDFQPAPDTRTSSSVVQLPSRRLRLGAGKMPALPGVAAGSLIVGTLFWALPCLAQDAADPAPSKSSAHHSSSPISPVARSPAAKMPAPQSPAAKLSTSATSAVKKPREFKRALPGYVFQFPQDHRSHNEFKTEWWYYTGHLNTAQGEPFGFELTFFRSGLDTSTQVQRSRWQVDNVYLAHFAVSDISRKKFFFRSQTNRPGPMTGGADGSKYKVWNGGWSANLRENTHVLKAGTPEYGIDLELSSDKPPAVHGKDGVSQKANCKGCASHYYSMTRMLAKGTIRRGTLTLPVEGAVWMDHEFGSNQLTKEQVGWDWFSVQLEDNSEIMLYLMRLKSGEFDPNSSGTLIGADGKVEHLALKDFKIDVEKRWQSQATKADYPAQWHVHIPGKKLDLRIEPKLDNQELVGDQSSGISYWEGACKATGTVAGKEIRGRAYVELTGYAGDFTSDI